MTSGLDETALDETGAPITKPGQAEVDLPEVSPQRYEIAGEVGRGGLGRVVEAKDRYLDRKVALKELLASDDQSRRRFVREALITARLQHPSIVPVYDAGRWPDRAPFYAMKLVAGQRLLDKIKGSLTERLALVPTVLAVADAIAYAHSEHIVHRDLKPQNVLVGAFGETVVIDWGLAKDLATEDLEARDAGPYRNASAEHTVDGAVMGTPAYMPPEQAEGQEVDERADVYALGAMLYHVISGRAPHVGTSVDQMIARIVEGAVDPIATIEPEVPADLATIVAKAMARLPAQRYRNAAAFADDLRRFTTGQLVAEHRYTAAERLRRWLSRYRAVVAVGTIAAVVLITFGTWSIRRIVMESRATGEKYREAIANGNRAVIAQARGSMVHEPAESLAWLAQLTTDGPEWDAARVIAAEALERPRLEHFIAGSPVDEINWGSLDWQREGDMIFRFGSNELTAFDLAADTSHSYAIPEGVSWWSCADRVHAYGMRLTLTMDQAAFELDLKTGVVIPLPAEDDEDFHGLQKCVARTVFQIRYPASPSLVLREATGTRELTDNVKQAWPSGDNKHVVVRDRKGDVSWWDITTNEHEKIGSVVGPQDAPQPSLSADGRVAIFPDRPMRIMRTGKPPTTELADFAMVASDGKRIAFAARDSSTVSIDITDAELDNVAGLEATGRVNGMRFSTKSEMLVGFGDHTTVWDLASRIRSELGEERVLHMDFMLDDDHLGRWSADGSLKVWRLVKPRLLAHASGYLPAVSRNVHWVVDQSTVGVRRLDLTRKTVDAIMTPPDAEVRIVSSGSISNDGTVLLLGHDSVAMWKRGANAIVVGKRSPGARVRWSATDVPQMWGEHEVFDLTGGHERLVWTSPPKQFVIQPSDNFQFVIVLDTDDLDRAVRVVELATHRETKIPMIATRGVAVSADRRIIAGPALDGGVILFDLTTGASRVIQTPGTRPIQLEFSDDGQWLAVVGATTLTTIELATGASQLHDTRGNSLAAVVLDPIGHRVATTSSTDTRLYDLRSGEGRTLVDAAGQWVAFDGDRIVVGMPTAVVEVVDDLPREPGALAARIRALPFEIHDRAVVLRHR